MRIAEKLGGEEDRAAVEAPRVQDAFAEIYGIKQQLFKYRVLKKEDEFGTVEYWKKVQQTGEQQTSFYLPIVQTGTAQARQPSGESGQGTQG